MSSRFMTSLKLGVGLFAGGMVVGLGTALVLNEAAAIRTPESASQTEDTRPENPHRDAVALDLRAMLTEPDSPPLEEGSSAGRAETMPAASTDQAEATVPNAGVEQAARDHAEMRHAAVPQIGTDDEIVESPDLDVDPAEPGAEPVEPARQPQSKENVVTLQHGDTLIELLTEAGADRIEAHKAVQAMQPLYDPRALRVGQEVKLALAGPAQAPSLQHVEIVADVDRSVLVTRAPTGEFSAREKVVELTSRPRSAGGEITSSLYEAALDNGLPLNVLAEMIRVFSFTVDFQREIHPGDAFQAIFEERVDAGGRALKTGDLLYATLRLGSTNKEVFRFEVPSDDSVDYFVRDGHSVKRMLMRTPVDGARLSSGFGKRKHPILGYTKMHKGVDFAAPTGTPIMAAGDGVIDYIGRRGGYGNFVRIRHNGKFSTAYAHMHGFARGMAKGKRVQQGQVIGYIGSTGRSTGPHLHYEILVNGAQVNPMGVRVPVGRELEGQDLAAFKAHVAEIDRLRKRLDADMRVADASDTPKPVPSAVPKKEESLPREDTAVRDGAVDPGQPLPGASSR